MNLDLGPLESLPDPAAWTRQADKVERLRKAALHALATSDNGRKLIPDARRWAMHWANHPAIENPEKAKEYDL